METVYKTKIWGDKYCIRADWANASCPIETLDGEGNWCPIPSGRQVADFSGPYGAMAYLLAQIAIDGGDDVADNGICEDIDTAVDKMVEN